MRTTHAVYTYAVYTYAVINKRNNLTYHATSFKNQHPDYLTFFITNNKKIEEKPKPRCLRNRTPNIGV